MRSTVRVIPAVLAIWVGAACDKDTPSTTPPPETVDAEPASETSPAAETGPAEPTPDETADADEPASEGEEPQAGTDGSAGAWVESDGPVPVPEDPAEGLTEPTSFANVKLEIKTPDGKVMRDKGKVIGWQQPTKIPFEFQGGMHEFVVDVTRDGKTANVELSYHLDGVEIIRAYELETKIGKREVIRVEDGTGLAVTVTPKTIKPKSRPEREKIEKRKGKDPLSGAKR